MNAEYNYRLGIIVAVICGLFASFTGFGIAAGKAISSIAVEYGASSVMSNNATLVVLLLGGFLFNFFYYFPVFPVFYGTCSICFLVWVQHKWESMILQAGLFT